jgi:hypothetical protein
MRLLKLNSILQDPIPHALPMQIRSRTIRRRDLALPRIPLRPIQPPHPRPQYRQNPPSNQTETNRAISITIQRLPRILRITLKPNMIPRHDLALFHARLTSRNPIPR